MGRDRSVVAAAWVGGGTLRAVCPCTAACLAGVLALASGPEPSASPPTDERPPGEGPEEVEEGASGADTPYRTVVAAPTTSAQQQLDRATPGFATAIDLTADEVGARPSDALPELLARTPGASVRSIGGLGQFAAISLRGSTPQQVAVFLDGVPIDASLAGLVDLGSIPLDGLSRVEVYRGHVPVEFGGAAIGGAIDLVGAPASTGARAHVRGGVGSFGARESRFGASGPVGERVSLGGVVGYAAAAGDFPFYDDGGTPTITGDDQTRRRVGNGYDRLATQLRMDFRDGPLRASVQQLALYKHQSVPGRAGAQVRQTELDTLDLRTTSRVTRERVGRPGGRLGWVFGLGIARQRFSDPAGEVGLGIDDQRVLGVDTFASPRLRLALWRGAFLRLVGEQRTQYVDVQQRAATPGPSGDADRTRLWWGGGLALEQFAVRGRWLLVPGLRVDVLDARFAVAAGQGEQDDAGRDAVSLGLSPRMGTRFKVLPGVELRASVGRYFRPPTLLELFGDRGYIVGNEGLIPERGTAVDGGVLVDLPLRMHAIYMQLAGFATTSEDLIQWIAAGPVTRPENVAGATVRGLEASLAWTPRRRLLTVSADYTFTDSRSRAEDPAQRGQPLPGRPRHDLFVRATSGLRRVVRGVALEPRLAYLVDVVSGTFLDPSGRFELPPRAIQGIALELSVQQRAHLAFEIRNLLDVRTSAVTLPVAGARPTAVAVSDFLGYPLPGRSLWANVRFDFDLRTRERPRRRRGSR